MEAQQVLLAAFGSDDFFRTAYNYSLDEIYDWLDKVSKGEKGGSRVEIKEVRDELKRAFDLVKVLSLPDGKYYKDPRWKPDEHFCRTLASAPKETRCKFALSAFGFQRQDSQGKLWYWSPYDLLGYFLSLLGPAPQGANRNNYFLPLTAVYARWSSRIAGHLPMDRSAKYGVGDWPYMFQCTWYNETNFKKAGQYFSLGASLAGSEWRGKDVGFGWRERVGSYRFRVLLGAPVKLVAEQDWDKRNAPEQQSGGTGTAWGNCAETYPFTEQMRHDKTLNKKLYGLALGRRFLVYENEEYDEYDDGKIWRNVSGPCGNCEKALWIAGAKFTQFNRNYDRYKAPKRPEQSTLREVAAQAAAGKEAVPSTGGVATSKAGPVSLKVGTADQRAKAEVMAEK